MYIWLYERSESPALDPRPRTSSLAAQPSQWLRPSQRLQRRRPQPSTGTFALHLFKGSLQAARYSTGEGGVVQLLLGVTQALQVSLAHRATASSRSFRHAHDEPQVVDAQGRERAAAGVAPRCVPRAPASRAASTRAVLYNVILEFDRSWRPAHQGAEIEFE